MRVSWSDLGTSGADELDAQDVEIEGWLSPFEAGEGHRYFALTPDPACCVGCLPRDATLRVEVFAHHPVEAGVFPLTLRGRWRVLKADDAGWRYQLRDARPSSEPWRRGPQISRRQMLTTAAAMGLIVGAPTAAVAEPVSEEAARQAIADMATVDVHSHEGAILGLKRIAEHAPFSPVAAPMKEGGMAVLCLAAVSDSPTHRVMPDGRIHPFRDPAPGELYAFTQQAFQRVQDLIRAQELGVITDAASLAAARSARPSVVVAVEGGDFLEGQPDRIDEAYERWSLRHLQIVHYRVNELGDIQTEAPVHGGLTDAGAEAIRRCNRRGLVVDVAHATYDVVKTAASVTAKPLVLSHTSLSRRPSSRSRLISADHARAVAGTGGIVGIWPPQAFFPDMAAFAGGIARMVDAIGVDHVALGSDMRGLTGPSVFSSYRLLPQLARELLARGFDAADVGKLLGGNYQRVFAASMA